MPGDPLAKVQAGQRISIPAAAWNRMLAATQWVEQQRGRGAGPSSIPPLQNVSTILVKNDAGADLDRYAVVKPTTPLFFPDSGDTSEEQAAALATFKNEVVMLVNTPVEGEFFAILQEPVGNGATRLARAAVAGVTQVQIYVTEATVDFNCAEAEDGETGHLVLAENGSAMVLWREPKETGELPATVWAIVSLNSAFVTHAEFDGEECELTVDKRC